MDGDKGDISSRAAVRNLARRRSVAYRERAEHLIAEAGRLPVGAQRQVYLTAASRWISLAELQDAIANGPNRRS